MLMKLVVGLGNPGRQYVGTRHNIGFDAVDAFAQRLGWLSRGVSFERAARTSFEGLAIDGLMTLPSGGGEKVVLLKPMTYMNLSGRSVQAAVAFYHTPLSDLMVVLDEMALPVGKLRIRASGSSGGHNGLRDIERMLGTGQYPRLRIGIDPPPPFVPGKDYVLGRFTPEQRKALDPALDRAASALERWICKGVSAAMNEFNVEQDSKKDTGGTADR